VQSAALSARFKKLLGNHQYYQNCEQLERQVQYLEREMEQQLKIINKVNVVADQPKMHKSAEVIALEHFQKEWEPSHKGPWCKESKPKRKKVKSDVDDLVMLLFVVIISFGKFMSISSTFRFLLKFALIHSISTS
jgi:hypothetical protein